MPQLESDLGGGDEGEVAHEVLLARLLGGWACQVRRLLAARSSARGGTDAVSVCAQVCGRRAARDEDVDFDARVRLCATCRTSMCVPPLLFDLEQERLARACANLGDARSLARRLATTQELSDAYFHLHPRTLGCVFRTSPHDPNVHHPQFEYRY